MKRNFKAFVNIILIVLLISFSTISFANGFVDANEFDNKDNTPANVKNLVDSSAGTVISVLRVISVTIAVVMLLVISMKYMLSSAGDRADIKKHAVAYVVGAFILFGVTGILGVLVDLSNSI